jgi:phage terminase small subunit
VEFIANITEKKRFWTEIMRDENADMKYIAKAKGAFLRKAVLNDIVDY